MTPPLRVLAVFEGTTISGPAKNLLNFAAFARTDCQPQVDLSVAVFWRPGDSPIFTDAAQAAGIEIHRIPEQGRFDRSVLPALKDLTRRWAPDILQTHAVKAHFLTRACGLHRHVPWVAFHHGYTTTDLRTRSYNQLNRWSLRVADRVVTMNQPFRQQLMGTGIPGERISIVHNAIDPGWGTAAALGPAPGNQAALLARGEALKEKLQIPAGRSLILIAARLSKEKDHETLVRAMHGLLALPAAAERNPHLLIVGDGPERPRLDAVIAELGISSHVTFTGWVPSAEPYYGIASIAVLSSLSEGSPNALLEGLCAGVPVVATTVGGIPEIVQDRESALLVGPGDAAGMTGALAILLTNPELASKLRRRGREVIESRHVPQARAFAITEIYKEVLRNHTQKT